MAGRLQGKTSLITGASRGIGFGIADAFLKQGANVILVASNEQSVRQAQDRLTAKYDARIEGMVADVADRDACFDLVAKATAAFDGIDILVNCAGIYISKLFVDYSLEDFDRVMKINLYGVFNLMQAVLPQMLERKSGKIVNIASTAGKWGMGKQAAYNASKHGVVGLTRCAAFETAGSGITVNAICPGMVETDLLSGFMDDYEARGYSSSKAMRDELTKKVPIGRFVEVSECAHLAVYLASSESDGMTGQSILLDGGQHYV